MVSELCISVIIASISSVSRQLLPSMGSLGSVPPLHRLLRAARTSRRPSCLASFPSLGLTARASAETTGPPRFLENPRMHAAFFDPGRTFEPGPFGRCPTHRLDGFAFRCFDGLGSCHFSLSRLNRAAFTLAVYASQPGLPSVATQDSLPAWWPTFAGRDSNPLGSIVRFQECLLHFILLTQT